jgi:hypothetical protein
MSEEKFEEWCVLELMGHRKLAGHGTEVSLFGTAILRLDVAPAAGRTRWLRHTVLRRLGDLLRDADRRDDGPRLRGAPPASAGTPLRAPSASENSPLEASTGLMTGQTLNPTCTGSDG